MKIKELIIYGKNLLEKNNIEDSSIVSKMLAEFILGMDKTALIVNSEKEITEDEKIRYYLALIEIIQGMPVQYITNKQEFMKLDFYVDENVLIPQPDTENLVEEVLEISKNLEEKINVLDMCTGSGCIGVSIAKNIENVNVVMADISSKALEIAKKNYEKNIDNGKVAKFIETNMFEKIEEKFDIIVSNPPYIETNVIEELSEEVKREPHIALDGGKDGLDFYRILVSEGYKYLNENGYLCMEIGYDQKDSVIKLLEENRNYKEIYSKKDLAGNDRIIIAKI